MLYLFVKAYTSTQNKSMRIAIFTLILTFNMVNIGRAQKNAPVEKLIVQNVVTGLFDALAELDVEKVKSFCTADVKILESGEVPGR